jgi:Holliday junction resolvase-like predicted endonuclease
VSVERNLIISLLKLTKEGPVLIESVNKDARIPSAVALKLLGKLQNEGLIYLKTDSIEVDSNSKLKLAVKAASLGADVEHISNLLCWQEFEEIAALALKNNGYIVENNVRFKHAGHRWEIDVVGCRKPLVICIDCKHWQRGMAPSVLKRIVDSQVERTKALVDSLPNIALKLECTKWKKAKFIPSVLSLISGTFKFYDKVPVVPVLQLQDFINQLPAYTESLKLFPKTFNSLSHDFQN